MRCVWICICCFLAISCSYAPIETTVPVSVGQTDEPLPKTVTVGVFLDNRFTFGKESKKGEGEYLLVNKEVHMSMGEVRGYLAHSLRASGKFQEIINPPTKLVGTTFEAMHKKALETSDYLIVGEVNSFYVRNLGRNSKSLFTVPLDFTLFFIPNLFVFPLSGGKALLLTGGALATRTVECVLSFSLTIYSVETGHALTTFRVEQHAVKPVDSVTIYGDIYNDQDDWIDIGRSLGEMALNNACAEAVEIIGAEIDKYKQN